MDGALQQIERWQVRLGRLVDAHITCGRELIDGVSHADLLANGVSQADIDFLTWNDGDQRSYRTAKPCRGSRDDVGESKEECKS